MKGVDIMAEEHITETTDANGNVIERQIHRDTGATPVTVNTAPASSGGNGLLIALLVLVALAVGGYFLMAGSDSEARKDNAIAEAASDVGNAAEKAGAAVEKAADKIAN
jgi:uncharacterized protein HemX